MHHRTMISDEKNDDDDRALLHLAKTKVADRRPRSSVGEVFIEKSHNVLICRSSECLDSVFRKLTSENIQSMPIVDSESKFVGVVDYYDIIQYCCGLLQGCNTEDDIDERHLCNIMETTPVETVLKHRFQGEGKEVYHALQPGYSLLHAFEVLAQTGCNRVPVVNEVGRVDGIYTTSMAISDIRQTQPLLPNLSAAKVKDLIQSPHVFSFTEDMPAIAVFRRLGELRISGAPLVGKDGRLQSIISIRDFRGVSNEWLFKRLTWPIGKFREQSRLENPQLASITHWSSAEVPHRAKVVAMNDTFADVIHTMQDGCLHRLLVVADEEKDMINPRVISLITQTDVLRSVCRAIGTIRP